MGGSRPAGVPQAGSSSACCSSLLSSMKIPANQLNGTEGRPESPRNPARGPAYPKGIEIGGRSGSIAMRSGVLWVVGSDGMLLKFDAASGQQLTAIDSGQGIGCNWWVRSAVWAFAGGAGWWRGGPWDAFAAVAVGESVLRGISAVSAFRLRRRERAQATTRAWRFRGDAVVTRVRTNNGQRPPSRAERSLRWGGTPDNRSGA